MERLKSIVNRIYDAFELYIPIIAFIALVVSYVILIACRYLFKISLGWLNELNIMMFLLCAVMAASYGSRSGDHVVFRSSMTKHHQRPS